MSEERPGWVDEIKSLLTRKHNLDDEDDILDGMKGSFKRRLDRLISQRDKLQADLTAAQEHLAAIPDRFEAMEKAHKTAIEEMRHIELLAERILFLKGEVELVSSAEVEKITEPEKMLIRASQMEEESAADYNKAALDCSENADSASKQIFESLVTDEERHFDQYDKQLDNIKRFGGSYLALQSFGPGEAEGTP